MNKIYSLKSKITFFFLILISIYFMVNTLLSVIYIRNEKRGDLELLMTHALNESYDYIKKDKEKTKLDFLYEIPHMTSVLRKSGARDIEFFFTKEKYEPKNNEIVVSKILENNVFFNLKSSDIEIKKHIYQTTLQSLFWHFVFLLIIGVLGVYFIHRLLLPLSHIAKQCKDYKDENDFHISTKFVSSEIYELQKALNMLVRRFRNLRKKDKEIFTQAAHELKTPLAIIKARLDSYKENQNYDKESFIRAIEEDIQRLYLEIQSMLYFSIFDFDDKERFSALEVIEKSIQKVTILLEERNLKVTIQGEDIAFFARKNLFVKMFMSVFENAIFYAKKGSNILILLEGNRLHLKNTKSKEVNLFSSKVGIKILEKLSGELNFSFNIIKDEENYEVVLHFNKEGFEC